MKINLQNTTRGLIPLYDEDFEEKKKLKIGQIYSCEVKLVRNYEFHQKYFSLIALAWEYQNEKVVEHFKTKEAFRKTIEISAGYYEPIYSIERKEWIHAPKSISFSKMDNAEFQELYERVKDVLFAIFLKNISIEEFNKNLINY